MLLAKIAQPVGNCGVVDIFRAAARGDHRGSFNWPSNSDCCTPVSLQMPIRVLGVASGPRRPYAKALPHLDVNLDMRSISSGEIRFVALAREYGGLQRRKAQRKIGTLLPNHDCRRIGVR